METKHIVIFVGILAVALAFWFTRPNTDETSVTPKSPVEPWMTHEVRHLEVHGIQVNPSQDADVRVSREGKSLKVEISPAFLQKQEAGFLAAVGMLKPAETMSEERFAEFIDALHMTALTEEEKAGHTHEHQEGETHPHHGHTEHTGEESSFNGH